MTECDRCGSTEDVKVIEPPTSEPAAGPGELCDECREEVYQ